MPSGVLRCMAVLGSASTAAFLVVVGGCWLVNSAAVFGMVGGELRYSDSPGHTLAAEGRASGPGG